VSQEVK